MRRFLALTLAAALLLPAAVAWAQGYGVSPIGPGAIIARAATRTISNTAGAANLFSYQVPASFVAGGGAPLHLRLFGRVTTTTSASSAGAKLLVDFGGAPSSGTRASITINNNTSLSDSLTNAPWVLDVWIQSTASVTNAESMEGFFTVPTKTAGTPNVFGAAVLGNARTDVAQTLLVTWDWASATTANSISVDGGGLMVAP